MIEQEVFEELASLHDLNLSTNQIAFLDPGVFNRLSELRVLDLSFNRLESIDIELFRSLEKLTFVCLQSNLIKRFGPIFQNQRYIIKSFFVIITIGKHAYSHHAPLGLTFVSNLITLIDEI